MKLPAAGYQLGAGDAEQAEAEALFLGESVRGKWKVNGILNCPDAVTLTLARRPLAGSPRIVSRRST